MKRVCPVSSCIIRIDEEKKKMENKKNTKKIVWGVVALVALIAVMVTAYAVFGAKSVKGSKAITITVVNKAAEETKYDVKTDAEFLRQAMEETKGLTFEGTESEYGLMVESVNGEVADYNADGAYWSFYVNGEYCNYGIDSQPVLDGDAFKIVYTVYAEE